MEKEFIPYEEALVLKELGFDEGCFGFYIPESNNVQPQELIIDDVNRYGKGGNWILSPLYQQAFRWIYVKYVDILDENYKTIPHYLPIKEGLIKDCSKYYLEYQLKILRELIKIVKEK